MVQVRGRNLLKKYLKKTYPNTEEPLISIDYNHLNRYVIEHTGHTFQELKLHQYLEQINTDTTTYKLINVPENITLHELSAEHNNKWIILMSV